MQKAVAGIIIGNGQTLLIKDREETWILLSEKVEQDESGREALQREISEELPDITKT